jgi:hypothetical protein
VTAPEHGHYTFTAADFGFSDPNDSPPNDFYRVKVTTLPGAGTLTDNGAAVSAGDYVTVSDINAGYLVFTPAANVYGSAYASFTFRVQDDGGTANGGTDTDPSAKTMTVDVAQPVTITGFTFSVWLSVGDTLTSVDYQFTSGAFSGTVYGSGTAAVTLSGGTTNQYGFVQYVATVSGLNVSVPVGTSWLELDNAVSTQGDYEFWGENDGPSQAEASSYGSTGAVGSEAFALLGASATLYDSGADPGTISAWPINYGYAVTNSFTLP